MPSGIDLTTVLLIIAIVAILFVALDLLVAGGGMTGGMMGGMMGSPWGWGLLVLLAASVALLVLGRG